MTPDLARLTQEERARFWAKAEPEPNTGCWIWLGAINERGYGSFWFDGRTWRAPRLALELASGQPIATGRQACHRCDFPRCINPDHLFPGTKSENQQDAVHKGRHWAQRNSLEASRKMAEFNHKNPRRGGRSTSAKLTLAQVQEIRERYKRGGISQDRLAAEYGVSQSQVSFIILGQRWIHDAPLEPKR